MAIYLLCYDLANATNGAFDYRPLWFELQRLGAQKAQLSMWLLSVDNTPQEVVEHLGKFVHSNDRLWVSEVRHGSYWYVNAVGGTNTWLEDKTPG